MKNTKSPRFDLLDGLRGVAAVAVMVYHYTMNTRLYWLGGAWVSVDLFFILSGFVIAHSYGGKILNGMTFRQFMVIRLIRLGPLYLLGLALGFLAALLLVLDTGHHTLTIAQVFTALELGFAWIPYFNAVEWPMGANLIGGPIFPLNDPAWSLFFELFVNIAFFVFVSRFHKSPSAWMAWTAAAIFVGLTIAFHQENPGWGRANFYFGFPRVIAGFLFGGLIYSAGMHLKRYPVLLTIAVAGLAILLFKSERFALFSSLTLIPLTVVLVSSVMVEGPIQLICTALGEISYPIYILHIPLYRLIFELTNIQSVSPVRQTLLISTVCVLVALLMALLDMRVRKWLMRRWGSRKAAVPAV